MAHQKSKALQRFQGQTLPVALGPEPSAGAAESNLSGILQGFSRQAGQRADQEAATLAEQAGFDADPDAPLPTGQSISDRNFRRGALLAHNARIKITIRDTIDRLELDHESDPDAFNAQVDGFKEGFLSEVPALLKTEAAIELADKRSTAGIRILARQRDEMRNEQLAQLTDGIDSLKRESRIAARDLNESRVDLLQDELFDLFDQAIEADLLDADAVAAEKIAFVQQLDNHAVLGGFERILLTDGIQAAETALAAFKRVEGVDPVIREQMVTQMSTALGREITLENRQLARDRAELTARSKRVKKAVDNAVDVLDYGSQPDATSLSELLVAAEGTDHFERLAEAIVQQRVVSEFLLAPEVDQANLTDALRSKATKGTISGPEVRLIERLEKAQVRHAADLDADAWGLAISEGIIETPAPLDLSSGEALSESIAGRLGDAERAGEHYRQDVAPMTAAEIDFFTTQLAESSADEKVALLSAVVDGAGAQSADIFERMDKNNHHFWAGAGGLALEGVPNIAREVLVGAEQIAANSKIIPPPLDTQAIIDDHLGNFAAENPDHRANLAKSALALYAARSARPAPGEKADFSGNLDEQRLRNALEDVTGNMIRWHGSDFALRDVTSDEFENWIERSLSAADIDAMGGVASLSSADALIALRRTGELRAVSPGQFLVTWNSPTKGAAVFMHNSADEPFILIVPGFETGGPARPDMPPPIPLTTIEHLSNPNILSAL